MFGAQHAPGHTSQQLLPTLTPNAAIFVPVGQGLRVERNALRTSGIATKLRSSSVREHAMRANARVSRRSVTAPAKIGVSPGPKSASSAVTGAKSKEARPPIEARSSAAKAAALSRWAMCSVVRPSAEHRERALSRTVTRAPVVRPRSNHSRPRTSERPNGGNRAVSNRRKLRADPDPHPEPEPLKPTLSGELDRSLVELMHSEDGEPFAKPLAKPWQGMVAHPLDLSVVRQRLASAAYGEGSSLLVGVASDVRQVWENTRNVFGEVRVSQCQKAAACAARFELSLGSIARQFELEVPDMPPAVGRQLPRPGTTTRCSVCTVQSRLPSKPCDRTGLVFDEAMLRHRDMADKKFKHPEKPQRIARIFKELRKNGLVDRCEHVPSRKATREELQAVHSDELIDTIDDLAGQSKKARNQVADEMDPTNSLCKWPVEIRAYFNQSTAESAYLAAGSVIEMTQRILEGKLANGVAVVRPPGHHATCGCSMGFCVFNSVAVAARAALREHWGNARRVLILDWDVHHGNGTQKIFESDSSVLYISIHRYDDGEFFPGGTRGHFANAGIGTGRGYTVNIPWDCPGGRDGSPGDADYLLAFEQIVEPMCGDFRPDVVLVSAGFDAAVGDPLGGCQVTPGGFYEMTRRLQALPSAKGRVIIALEGGYNLKSTARSMSACTSALLGDACPVFDDMPKPRRTTSNGTGKPKGPKNTESGDMVSDSQSNTQSLSNRPAQNSSGATTQQLDDAQNNVTSITTTPPRFQQRIEEVKAALSAYWPALRESPQPLVPSISSSAPGVVPGQQLRLRCDNSYRRISSSVAKAARTGPPGMKLVHEWSLRLRLADEDDPADVELCKKVDRVEFRLDESFNSAVIVVRRPPFAVARRSWTTGSVGVTLFFKPSTEMKVLSTEGSDSVSRLAAEAWGSSAHSQHGTRCRPRGPALRPGKLSHVLSFAEGGASAVYTVSIEEEPAVSQPETTAVVSGDNTDDDWSLLTPQERRREALRRRREQNARQRQSDSEKSCELGESAVGALFFGR